MKLFRGIHAEGLKRGMDHDALRDLATENYQVYSMAKLSDAQLLAMYRMLSGGKKLKNRGNLPSRGELTAGAESELVYAEDLTELDQCFAEAGFSMAAKLTFTRRQLDGRDYIRTRGDLVRVMAGIRAFLRRKA
jgi:hypothetical protein